MIDKIMQRDDLELLSVEGDSALNEILRENRQLKAKLRKLELERNFHHTG